MLKNNVAISYLNFGSNGVFVAISSGNNYYGSNNIIAYSTDGKNWNAVTQNIHGRISAISYNGSIFVGGGSVTLNYGQNYYVTIYSYDGINWTVGLANNFVFNLDCQHSYHKYCINTALRHGKTEKCLVCYPDYFCRACLHCTY